MLRTAMTRRFLGLLAIALVVGATFVQLGRWQLGVAEGRAHREAVEEARAAPPVALTDVLEPFASFPGELSSRPVTASGRYTAGELLVPRRRLSGVEGSWVLTPFVVDGSGATLPVLRGFVPRGESPGPAPTGPVTLSGGLAPPESPVGSAVGAGEIGSVDTSILVNTWSGDLYNAFLFLQSEQPAAQPQLTKVPTPLGPTGVNWRNAAYAVQWWVFAVFVLWMWWRMVRDEHLVRGATGSVRAEPDPEAHPVPGPGPGPEDRPMTAASENGRREHL